MKREFGRRRWWLLAAVWLAGTLVLWLVSRSERPKTGSESAGAGRSSGEAQDGNSRTGRTGFLERKHSGLGASVRPEEVVATKVSQFARNRFELVKAMARKFKVEVSPEIAQFFAAAEAGRWEEMQTLFQAMVKQKRGEQSPENLQVLWPTILETFGVAEQAHEWPAQQLLDYGQSILDSLRPGMIYVGGTDPGRFIPTLLNETSEGEHHIILTQNALADNSYLRYVGFLYSDQMSTLSSENSQRAFQEYSADAQKRALHDQNFPDEPKQVRPGEDVRITDGRVQISGQIAVMGINEKLFQFILEQNPDATFAIEQSFPLVSTYSNASSLGPIMEVRVSGDENALTAQRAAEAVERWRETAQGLLSGSDAPDSAARKTYAKMAAEQGSLFQSRNYTDAAEQAFRIATEICPSSPEPVFRYANLLVEKNRYDEAARIVENALFAAPDNEQFRDLARSLRSMATRAPVGEARGRF